MQVILRCTECGKAAARDFALQRGPQDQQHRPHLGDGIRCPKLQNQDLHRNQLSQRTHVHTTDGEALIYGIRTDRILGGADTLRILVRVTLATFTTPDTDTARPAPWLLTC